MTYNKRIRFIAPLLALALLVGAALACQLTKEIDKPTAESTEEMEEDEPPTPTPLPPTPTRPAAVEWVVYASTEGDNDDDDTSDSDIWVVRVDGSEARQLTFHENSDRAPDLSPDGTRVVFDSSHPDGSGLYVINIDGSGLTRLTDNYKDRFPTWSADGGQIAFVSERDGGPEIYIMDADGNDVERLTENDLDEQQISWSPDGRYIAFSAPQEEFGHDIYLLTVGSGDVTKLTEDNNFNVFPRWSPDGQQLVYNAWLMEEANVGRGMIFITENSQEIFLYIEGADGGMIDLTASIKVMNADGSGTVELTSGEFSDWSPSWSPDGQYIVFASNREGDSEIYIMNADGSGITALTDNDKPDFAPRY